MRGVHGSHLSGWVPPLHLLYPALLGLLEKDFLVISTRNQMLSHTHTYCCMNGFIEYGIIDLEFIQFSFLVVIIFGYFFDDYK